jgi:hypothetical protein
MSKPKPKAVASELQTTEGKASAEQTEQELNIPDPAAAPERFKRLVAGSGTSEEAKSDEVTK